ncbi:hypothetical protein DYB26_005108 [Aphanomyces astaci]|uniref:Mitogen-activated protein kinase n=1 Tax=Aphanomyces astaci TaxID=112090 RepID=A0A418EAU0_APHAT|nr:hypothetical protein DYB26_005108 [Aphanomyces astaci]
MESAATIPATEAAASSSATDRRLEQLPIQWEGYLRKRGDWLPRWDYYLVVLDGLRVSYYDRLDGPPAKPHAPSLLVANHTTSSHPSSLPNKVRGSGSIAKPRGVYTIQSFHQDTEQAKVFKFSLTMVEKQRVMHFQADSSLELVLWKQMIKAALDQDVVRRNCHKPTTESPSPALNDSPLPPYAVDLAALYDAYGDVCRQVGNFAMLLPCLHPNVVVTSNYPPCVPMSGTFHGLGWHTGFLKYMTTLHDAVDMSHFRVTSMAREGDLAVVSGKETLVNKANKRRFRQVWRHELRFEVDGRVSHINIMGDSVASSVAFSSGATGPALLAIKDKSAAAVPTSVSSPPGELRVVCVSAEGLKAKKTAAPTVKFALTGFPHLMVKGGADKQQQQQPLAFQPTVYSTRLPAKIVPLKDRQGHATAYAVYWAETVDLNFSGAVPGTVSHLFVEVWVDGFLGDELVGVTRINLASVLALSHDATSDEELALGQIPQWYDLVKPEVYSKAENPKTATTVGRLQLSLAFFSREDSVADVVASPSRGPRKSLDRLAQLHLAATSSSSLKARSSSSNLMDPRRLSSSDEMDLHAMHNFTVSGTKFRIYSRYQLIRAIGHGAYGVVIAASDQVTGNAVAIKNIPKTFDDLVDAKRIVREIRLMRHLTHPNIVHVLDVMRPPSLAKFEDTYIVTDLMETDLHRVVQSPEPLECDHIAYMTYQLLAAVRYMHSANVLHRDIKPSNVLVNRDCLVKVCDFGLARGISSSSSVNASTPSSSTSSTSSSTHGELVDATPDAALTEYVVTRWYRAPELLLSSKYSYPVDTWSVGCIVAEMFNRTALFPGHDHVHQLQLVTSVLGSPSVADLGFVTNEKAKRWLSKQATQVPRPWTSVVPSAPPDAIDLLQNLLKFDPRQRISIDDALRHPFVAPYMDDDAEVLAPTPFDFSFEQLDPLDKPALQRLIFQDVCHFHPDALDELTAATTSTTSTTS